MTYPRALFTAAALVVCSSNLAIADETYTLEGEHSQFGKVSSTLRIGQGREGLTSISLDTHFHQRPDLNRVVVYSEGRRSGDTITAKKLTMQAGALGRLDGVDTVSPENTLATVTYNADGSVSVFVIDVAGNMQARSQPNAQLAETPSMAEDPASEDTSTRDKLRQKGKHLIAIAKEKLEELSYDGVRLQETFKVHDYFHVGVGGAIRVVDPATWSEEQRISAQAMQRPLWLVNEVEGGVRVPLTTSIDLGEVGLNLGFVPSAKVTYEVTDLYEKPEGLRDRVILDDLRSMADRSFDLPLDAEEARAMTPGAQRVMDGEGTVAISGQLRYGRDVTDMGEVVRIGAVARVGGFYKLQGKMRVDVTRLQADMVRVRVTRGTTKTRQASADLLIGAVVDEDAAQEETGVSSLFIKPAASAVEDVISIELDARRTRTIEDEVDISFLLDLGQAEVRRAYEKAVRGDLTLASDLAAKGESGVHEEFRVMDLEDRTYTGAELKLSKVAGVGASRETSLEELAVQNADGTTSWDIFRYERERHGNVGSRDRKRGVSVEIIRQTNPDGTYERSLRYEFTLVDPSTTSGDAERFRRLLRGVGLDDSIDARKDRKLISRYYKTRTTFVVTVGERGLAEILQASQSEALAAYVHGFTVTKGRDPVWATSNGRRQLRNRSGERAERARREWEKAYDFVLSLGAFDPSADADARAEHLEKMCKAAGYDQLVIAALIKLAPAEAVSIQANMAGDRLTITDGVNGAEAGLIEVGDPRR